MEVIDDGSGVQNYPHCCCPNVEYIIIFYIFYLSSGNNIKTVELDNSDLSLSL